VGHKQQVGGQRAIKNAGLGKNRYAKLKSPFKTERNGKNGDEYAGFKICVYHNKRQIKSMGQKKWKKTKKPKRLLWGDLRETRAGEDQRSHRG